MSHGYNVHEGVSCDGCGFNNFGGNRYKCLRCYDFDLCHACYTGRRFPHGGSPHSEDHPMQMMLTQRDFEVIYEGDQTKNFDICKICAFTCPVCGQSGLTVRTFGNHINTHTYPLEEQVYCPLCIAYPGDANRSLHDLKEHMSQTHSHLDNAPYRTEPARAANRRPQLARRTQRQPAGQAGTFTTQQLGINLPLNSINWPAEDVEDMLRLANLGGRTMVPQNVANRLQRLQNNQGLNQLNQMLNAGIHPNLPQIFGAPRPAEPQTPAHALQIQQDQQHIHRSMNALSVALARNTATTVEARSNGVYAQPRHTVQPRLPLINQPIARLLRSSSIFPVSRFDEENMMSSSDVAELTGDENDYISGEEGLPPLEQDSSQEEDLEPNASTSGVSVQPLRGGSQGNVETDSEFEFENPEDESNEASEADELQSGSKRETSGMFPTEQEILANLSENTTPTEFTQLMRILQEDPESDYEPEEADDRHFSDCTDGGDSLEEQLGKLVWSTIQFDVPPLSSFGTFDSWNDQRFLRHRKLQRKTSCASSMEDTLRKADVALSFLNVAAGRDRVEGGSKPRVFDKPDRSVRRALKILNLDGNSDYPIDEESCSESDAVPSVTNGQTNGHAVEEEVPEEEAVPRTPTVKFQPTVDDGPRPEEPPRLYMYYNNSGELSPAPDPPGQDDPTGDSSEEEEEEARSLAQEDDVDFIDDSELQQ